MRPTQALPLRWRPTGIETIRLELAPRSARALIVAIALWARRSACAAVVAVDNSHTPRRARRSSRALRRRDEAAP